MVTKRSEWLEIETGIIYVIYHMSKHGTQLLLKSRRREEGEFILHTNPRRIEEITSLINLREWVPNSPATRALYGIKDR